MNNVAVFGPSAEKELSEATSISLIMNTDRQTCLRNLLRHQLKRRATVIDFPTQCGRDGMSVEEGNYITPLLSPLCTCVDTD